MNGQLTIAAPFLAGRAGGPLAVHAVSGACRLAQPESSEEPTSGLPSAVQLTEDGWLAPVPCEICGDKATTDDHDHVNGRFRGDLCNRCNMGLGSFRDQPELLRAAANYIERWKLQHEAHPINMDQVMKNLQQYHRGSLKPSQLRAMLEKQDVPVD